MNGFIGEDIRKRRKELGLSVRETARRAKISHAYLSQLERGVVSNPSRGVVRELSEVLGLSGLSGLDKQEPIKLFSPDKILLDEESRRLLDAIEYKVKFLNRKIRDQLESYERQPK